MFLSVCKDEFFLALSCDQPHSPKDARNVSAHPSPDAATIGPPRDATEQTRTLDGGGELAIIPPYGSYGAHEQAISYGGKYFLPFLIYDSFTHI